MAVHRGGARNFAKGAERNSLVGSRGTDLGSGHEDKVPQKLKQNVKLV